MDQTAHPALHDEACDVPFLLQDGEACCGIDGSGWLSARLRGRAMPPRP